MLPLVPLFCPNYGINSPLWYIETVVLKISTKIPNLITWLSLIVPLTKKIYIIYLFVIKKGISNYSLKMANKCPCKL